MRIDRSLISNTNTYSENDPKCIVVHNTDNFRAGADARTHAEAQHNGELSNMSAHYYVDDGETAYQAAPHSRGCWHVGINYGNGNLFGTYGNRNSIGVEMCVQGGYNYEKAFQHTVELVKYLMKETGIPASRVYRHLDICSKNCPSQINARGDWTRFKKLIRNGNSDSSGSGNSSGEKTYKPGIYRVNTDLNIREKPDADSRRVERSKTAAATPSRKFRMEAGDGCSLVRAGSIATQHTALTVARHLHPIRSRPQKRSRLTAFGGRS